MTRLPIIILILALVLTSASLTPAFAQSDDDNPLLDMLAHLPDTPEARAPGNYINFVDFEANQTALQTDLYALYDVTGSLWANGLNRVNWGGAAYFFPQLEDMPDAVGFGWRDVDRLFEAGNPRDVLVVYEGDFDTSAIDAALTARDFASEERGGVSVWHRFEDNAISPELRDPADPFGGHLGGSARVADYGDQLVFARDWPVIEGAIAARTSDAPSLADADDYRTLAEAINSEGLLIRTMILPEDLTQEFTSPEEAPSDILERLPETWNISIDGWGTLPPPIITAIADQQQGEDQIHIIALVYDNTPDAEIAAEEVSTRLQTFDPALYEALGVSIDAPRIYENDSGFSVALTSVRYPLVLEPDPETDEIPVPGQLMARWQNMLFGLDFVILASEIE